MLTFKNLKYKNFLSSGNQFTVIDFQSTTTTLVVGHNGAGKSTMLDALSFALFGKPHRKVTKAQLVNSINNKGCLVEVEFSVGSKDYKVVRGMKPNVFEIWVGGNMINQNAHAKEYQQVLEKNILKLNHKSFHQIVVLGSSSFVPFMQLNSGARREVIEDLLDINIFSKMNTILKEKVSLLKEQIKANEHEIDVIKTKISASKKYLRDLTAVNAQHRKDKELEISNLLEEVAQLQDFNAKHMQESITRYEELSTQIDNLTSNRQKLVEYQSTFKTKIRSIVKEAKFYEENEDCPSCGSDISEEKRDSKISEAKEKSKELKETMSKADEQMAKFNDKLAKLNAEFEEVRTVQNEVNNNNQTITRLNKSIDRLRKDIDGLAENTGELKKANEDLEQLNTDLHAKHDEKYKLVEQNSYYQVEGEMLRDSGIKTKIIKQYIPVINQLTNKYLQILDFFVHFDLDENFNETIKSRFRDNFSYDSFSEGEKQRIDLSLLFTWRQIAKMKNSVATNLLVLDETFDSSLDDDGVDNLMKIISSLGEDTNIFVISHKSELEDAHFERRLEFFKDKNFSRMREAS